MKIAVLVSGGGTNLQAIIDQIDHQTLRNVALSMVISSSHSAYALERARIHGIFSTVISKKDFADLAAYDDALLDVLTKRGIELVVLAGFL